MVVTRLLDEVMILPVTTIGLQAFNWRTFSIVWFFFQSVDLFITNNTLTPSQISLLVPIFFSYWVLN